MKILNKEEEKSYESYDESSLYEDDLIQEYDIEEEEENSQEEQNEEEILEEMLEEVLNEQQKEGDEKIIKQLDEIREQYQRILEKIEIHKDILKEISESEESKQIKSVDQLKYTNKTFVESDIKLERMLNGLDSLVGASEEVRPLKKKLVQEIQKTISDIEMIKSNELKSIQTKIDKLLQIQSQNEKSKLPPPKKDDNQEDKKNQPKPSTPFLEQSYQPLPKEINNLIQQIQQINLQKQKDNQEQQKKQKLQQLFQQQKQQEREQSVDELIPFLKLFQTQPSPSSQKVSSKKIKVRKIEVEEEERGFPFPSKEQWLKLRFEPEFKIQKTRSSYLISSKISGINVENVLVEADEGILSIKGSKYPSFEEQQFLARELIKSIGNNYLLNRLTRDQITLAFLKLASQYNFGKFSVKYELPPNTSVDNIDATFNNGVLQIQLPIENNLNKNIFFSQNRNHNRQEVPFYGIQNKQQQNMFWDFL